ncbi:ABC transporter ATP-binding protein [Clostridiaceae bacterium HSG29]|nr:ABC transporter ATP-binding protein [Clostridiaceae bacterium HSG29]
MGKRHGMMKLNGKKAKNFKGTFKRLLSYLNEYKYSIGFVALLSILSSLFSIAGPKLLGNITTVVFNSVVESVSGNKILIDFIYIKKIVIILIAIYILSTFFNYIQRYIMVGISMKVSYDMRKKISEKINKLPLKYFDTTNHGEVLSRLTNDVDAINRTLSHSMSQIIISFSTIIGVTIMMFYISPVLAIVTILILPLSMIFVMQIVKRSQKIFKKQQDYLGHLNGHIEETFSLHLIVKAFNGEKKEIEKFNKLNDELFDTAWKSQFLSSLMMPIIHIIGNMGYVAVAVIGAGLVAQGKIFVGDIQAFIQYVKSFTHPMAQIANISNVLQQTVAAAERVFEFLDEEELLSDEIDKNEIIRNEDVGNVIFNDVNFGYTENKIIINKFSANIKSGQKIAIVGPTGAGKTTIVKLLMRYYDINSGEIIIDGINIKNLKKSYLREQIGMVLQDTWLYSDSVLENIRYGRMNATEDEVIEVAKLSHVDSFVKMLPDGYNMLINEDTDNISEGQKQLITIARTMLSNPKILILDEATSSVDTRTEIQIQVAMDRLMKNKTSFIIAHRLSTIKNADIILVMNEGDIVESGNHSELLELNGFYSKLYNSQFSTL